MSSPTESPDDIFNILVATDIHLGYNETDQIRGDDSFVAFEEILQYAVEYQVDFILLGGDLFHDAKPSPSCMLRCTTLLRKYCFGDKPVAFEILSDQSENFKESTAKTVNYEDPNINVSYPLFSIHGNHDDPIGKSAVSSLDILSKIGLVNYVGKWTNYAEVVVSPVLMKKGKTNLALYGLGHLKDQRLVRLFNEGKVKIEKVDSDEEWFNILTLHQNRADRGYKNYIPEEVLPDFMDLIIWGHEHDCIMNDGKMESWNPTKSFHVVQPGSSVATSLAHGESLPKHCGLLQVYEKKFKMIPLKLNTVRPFVFEIIVLSDIFTEPIAVKESEIVQKHIEKRVEDALAKANCERSGHPDQPKLPLIRLSVFYEREEQLFNAIRFGQQFSDRVANPQDLIMLKREKAKQRIVDKADVDMDALDNLVSEVDSEEVSIESLLELYYRDLPDDKKLSMLSVKCLTEAVRSFTQKGHNEAFSDVIDCQSKEYMKYLMQTEAQTIEEIEEQISICKELHFSDSSTETAKIKQLLETITPSGKTSTTSSSRQNPDSDDDDDDIEEISNPNIAELSTRGSRGGRGRGRGAKKKSPPPPKAPSTRARGRGSRGGRGAKSPSNPNASKLNITSQTPSNASNWLTNYSQRASTRTSSQTSVIVAPTNKQPIYVDDSDSD